MQRWFAVLLVGAVAMPSLVCAQNEEGRRNTAIGLTAGAIYALSKGKDTLGLGLAAGAAYAWKRYWDAKQERERREAAASGRSYARSTSRPYRSTGYRHGTIASRPVAYRSVSTAHAQELSRLRAAHAAQQAQNQQLKARLTAMQQEVTTLRQQIAQQHAALAQLASENATLRQALQEQRRQARTAQVGLLGILGVMGLLVGWLLWGQLHRYRIRIEAVAPKNA